MLTARGNALSVARQIMPDGYVLSAEMVASHKYYGVYTLSWSKTYSCQTLQEVPAFVRRLGQPSNACTERFTNRAGHLCSGL